MKIVLALIVIFVTGIKYNHFNSSQTTELVAGLYVYSDYEEGVEYAKKMQKSALLYFKDRRSPNCLKFENNVFSDGKVKTYLNKNVVIICLLVDDKTTAKTGKNFKTKGEYNYSVEKVLCKSDIQPYFALLDKQSNYIKGTGYIAEVNDFLKFLKEE